MYAEILVIDVFVISFQITSLDGGKGRGICNDCYFYCYILYLMQQKQKSDTKYRRMSSKPY